MKDSQLAHFKVALISAMQQAELNDKQMFTIYTQVLNELHRQGVILKSDSSSTQPKE